MIMVQLYFKNQVRVYKFVCEYNAQVISYLVRLFNDSVLDFNKSSTSAVSVCREINLAKDTKNLSITKSLKLTM